MANEEALLRALNGEKLAEGTTFHPQNNKQAYLAYAVGLLTDPDALPAPRTNEEVLLRELCVNGIGCDIEITNAAYMFYNGNRMEQFDEIASMFGELIDIGYMLYGVKGIQEIDLTKFDITSVRGVAGTFQNSGFERIILGNLGEAFFSFQYAFSGNTLLKSVEFEFAASSDVDYTISFDNAFNGCTGLAELPIDFSKITKFRPNCQISLNSAFYGCSGLSGVIDLGGLPIKSCSSFLYGCKSVEGIVNAPGIVLSNIPYGSQGAPFALKRLTFVEGATAPYMPYGARIQYCSFTRDGLVELFNSLPSVSSCKLTITGNPGVTGTLADGTACDVLTDEDRAIATGKGWTLVE